MVDSKGMVNGKSTSVESSCLRVLRHLICNTAETGKQTRSVLVLKSAAVIRFLHLQVCEFLNIWGANIDPQIARLLP